MKKVFAIILVFVAAIVLCRWLSRTSSLSPGPMPAHIVNSAPSPFLPKSVTPPPTSAVEAPKLAAAPLAPNADAHDPQENLDTAIADVARLAQADDFLQLFDTYGAPLIDPTLRYSDGDNVLTESQQRAQSFQAYIQSPRGAEERQRLQGVLVFIKTQAPVYNPAGDQAMLQFGPMTDQLRAASLFPVMTFVKKDGRWYLQAGNPFGW